MGLISAEYGRMADKRLSCQLRLTACKITIANTVKILSIYGSLHLTNHSDVSVVRKMNKLRTLEPSVDKLYVHIG